MDTVIEIKEITLASVWQIRHEVMWPNKPPEFVKLPNDEDGQHLGLFLDQELVSVISLFHINDEIQFRKFATRQIYQRKGFGSVLLKHVFNLAKQTKASRIWCNARFSKKSYYEKFEMTAASDTFLKSGISYITMEKYIGT